MTTTTTDLIDVLVERQRAEGLTDSEFVAKLGINRTSWWWLRTRQRQPSRQMLSAIVQAYPEYAPLVTLFLLGDVSHANVPDSGTNGEAA